jgi:transcriptional regulator with XRE-family HTH domain
MKNELGRFLEQKQIELDLALRPFAEKLGLSHSYLDSLMKGFNPKTRKPVSPTIETLEKIALGLGMNLTELLQVIGVVSINPELETQYLKFYFQHNNLNLDKLDNKPLAPEELELIKTFREIDVKSLTAEEAKGLKALTKAYLYYLKEDK